MTREEAKKLYRKYYPDGKQENAIDLFIQLGILKVDPPREPNQVFMSAVGAIPIEKRDCGALLSAISMAGLRLVEKSDG